jgi:hypothetical protein
MELAALSPTSSAADVKRPSCAIHLIPKSLQEQLPCSPHDVCLPSRTVTKGIGRSTTTPLRAAPPVAQQAETQRLALDAILDVEIARKGKFALANPLLSRPGRSLSKPSRTAAVKTGLVLPRIRRRYLQPPFFDRFGDHRTFISCATTEFFSTKKSPAAGRGSHEIVD